MKVSGDGQAGAPALPNEIMPQLSGIPSFFSLSKHAYLVFPLPMSLGGRFHSTIGAGEGVGGWMCVCACRGNTDRLFKPPTSPV